MHFFELRTRSISVCMSVIRQTDSGMRVVRQLPSAGGSRAQVLIRIRVQAHLSVSQRPKLPISSSPICFETSG